MSERTSGRWEITIAKSSMQDGVQVVGKDIGVGHHCTDGTYRCFWHRVDKQEVRCPCKSTIKLKELVRLEKVRRKAK